MIGLAESKNTPKESPMTDLQILTFGRVENGDICYPLSCFVILFFQRF
jgi:hypothetical protein